MTIQNCLDQIKNPKIVDGIPQTGTPLWQIIKLVESGETFPEEEIDFIESLLDGHYEQVWMAENLLDLLYNGSTDE